jgi:hypothetical protein
MLVRVLEAERYPWVRVDARRIDAGVARRAARKWLLDADISCMA